MVLVRTVPVLLLSCLAACGGARAKARVSTSTATEAEVDFDKEGPLTADSAADAGENSTLEPRGQSARSAASNKNVKLGPPALLGARHDVRLSDPGQKVACRCLAAVRGDSAMAGLTWSDLPPQLDESTQTLIVIESEGVPCGDAKATGASYMGYHKEGADVVVDVESAHPGRPITRGAVVPMPGENGRIVIASPPGLPYGKALQGEGKCKL
jgi:hypothetical protein